uniref:Ionotropic glutamate receptor L-glutamate and glycine-binding domain-containing protein n=1 Tax=Anopheles culicifacies TaxID=139723 RepID=A0A2C9GUM7_9DIPT
MNILSLQTINMYFQYNMNQPCKTLLVIIAISSVQVFADMRLLKVTQYVTNVTHFIKDQYSGSFVCWLLQYSEAFSPSVLHNTLAQMLFTHEDLLLMQADLSTPYKPSYLTPNTVTIFVDSLKENVNVTNLGTWLNAVPYQAVVVLLFKLTDPALVPVVAKTFLLYGIVHLVMISINQDAIYTFNYAPLRILTYSGFPYPQSLLYNRLKALEVRSTIISFVSDSFNNPAEDATEGEDAKLFRLFFGRYNIIPIFQESACDGKQNFVECLAQKNALFIANRLSFLTFSSQLVDTIEMDKIVIFTPKGKPMTFAKILLLPFQVLVWISLLIVCCIVYLIGYLTPSFIHNDLILLALMGIEKRNLRLTSRFEKLFAASLIVLFFQLKCAYETKFMSYMIDGPTESDPKTIADLRHRNCQVIVNSKLFDPTLFREPLAELMVVSHDRVQELKGRAMLANYLYLQLVFKDAVNIDSRNGKYRYVILKDSLGERIPFFFFRNNNLFQWEFQKFRRYVYEAGLQQHWRSKIITYKDKNYKKIIRNITNIKQDIVRLDTLKPLFFCMIQLWILATVIWICEIVFFCLLVWKNNFDQERCIKRRLKICSSK